MRVLFVSSGNSSIGISPIIKNQAESITDAGLRVDFFTIKEKGMTGYLKSIKPLKKQLIKHNYDIVHAHYSLSAFVASLAGAKPLIVSLMGSDVKAKFWYKWLIYFFYKFSWSNTIVKSDDMKSALGFKNLQVIPNGVDFSLFYHKDKIECQEILGWNPKCIQILFPSNPKRPEKNFRLLEKSFEIMERSDWEIQKLIDIPNNEIPLYLNASDIIVLTSLWEGSPNVIKEAMACNKTIVSTNVGDVAWLFGSEPGHFTTNLTPEDVANNINIALQFIKEHKKTKGKERIVKLDLDSKSIAKKIISIYKKNIKS